MQQIPRPEYPRPQFERERWHNLNGVWQFAFDDQNEGLSQHWERAGRDLDGFITVPFCYQSESSGIGDTAQHDVMWYKRVQAIPRPAQGSGMTLHFGAVDYHATVWLDGQLLGEHRGGWLPFSFDITPWADGAEHTLALRVEDTLSPQQLRGKQCWTGDFWGCWYIGSSGIWQTVWLEEAGLCHFDEIRFTPDIDRGTALCELQLNRLPANPTVRLTVTFEGRVERQVVCSLSETFTKLTVDVKKKNPVDNLHLWEPGNPNLYDVTAELLEDGVCVDRVRTYFGMRKVHLENGKIYLNNVELYQKLILDQGYWRESLITPPSDDAIRFDVEATLALGYNGARKHQKIEDPRYYYWADKLGLLVWGELPSGYQFSNHLAREATDTMAEFVTRCYNHPSIIVWLPLNESWGVRDILTSRQEQAFARGLCHLIKGLDPTRLVSSNDGWECVDGDIVGVHDYEAWSRDFLPRYRSLEELLTGSGCKFRQTLAQGEAYSGQALLLTEYGAISMRSDFDDYPDDAPVSKPQPHLIEPDGDALLARYEDITGAIKSLPYFRGYCYTQLTDVFYERNGFLTMDRRWKLDPQRVKRSNDSAL